MFTKHKDDIGTVSRMYEELLKHNQNQNKTKQNKSLQPN